MDRYKSSLAFERKEKGTTGQKVPCPVCHGNGYVEARPKEVRNCYYCHSQGEVTRQKAQAPERLLWRY
jgi:DnaJ-class molecular chaperone